MNRPLKRSRTNASYKFDEITFSRSLLSELRAVDFVAKLVKEGKSDPKHYKQVLIHIVEG